MRESDGRVRVRGTVAEFPSATGSRVSHLTEIGAVTGVQVCRSGESLPPVSLYRVGGRHFVQDGHHRVSASRAIGRQSVDAYVTEVLVA